MRTHQTTLAVGPAPFLGRVAAWVLALWFVAALAAGAAGLVAGGPAGAVGVVAGGPVLAFAVGLALSPALRRWAQGLPPRPLLLVHVVRVVGVVFLVLGAQGRLPTAFAFPAGGGDVAVALAAPFAALATPWRTAARRRGAWLFSLLGLADLVMAVSIGVTLTLGRPAAMAAMTSLPLSLVPIFFVPALAIAHLIVMVQLAAGSRHARGSGADVQ